MDWWLRLRHGGQLLDRAHLDELPPARPFPRSFPARLRAALAALPDQGAATGETLSALLDLLLEEAPGIEVGWMKGSSLGPEHGETLLDGTRMKPRRVWQGPHGGALHVFTTEVRQLGLHKGRRPVAQVIEYLRRRRTPLGLITNGRQWRLIHADADTQAWVEWDVGDFFSGGRISESIQGFGRLLGWRALAHEDGAGRSELLTAILETRQGQAKLSAELGERVREAVEALLASRRPVLEAAWDELDSQAVYVAACHFVMRLVVTLFAEARGLLPLENPVYHNAYGVTGLLESLDKASPLRLRDRSSAWFRLLALFSLLYEGSPHQALILPAYGGALFRPGRADGDAVQRAIHLLESAASPPDDEVIRGILVKLTRTTVRVREGRAWRRVSEAVNFSDLSSEYIGILYEGLLDYELHKAGDDAVLFLNLGDQPALPISRLEAMSDKAIKALVEKVKGSTGLVITEDDEVPGAPDQGEDGAPSPDDQAEPEADGLREAALLRAMSWARRAVKLGKLVKRAKGRDQAAQQQRAADALIGDLKLPGELYLVRWGGTRKGTGTFYTRPQLTMPTVRRTLEPLVDEGELRRTPEQILQLKVLDPAMGSGSFLVAALRVLTNAIYEAAFTHKRVQSEGNRTRVEIKTFAKQDRVFPFVANDPRFGEALTARVKRYVVEHCLYGVDIDPLAVELARVALWIETLDEKLPFTFLDHRLKAGNSLVGCWLDRFRDYPALAWLRESPDKRHRGVHHAKNTWHRALLAKKKTVIAELKDSIDGQRDMGFAGGDDTQVREDVRRIRSLFGVLRRVPASQPARRARIYRRKIQRDPALARLKEAFDAWCALWFWPLDELDTAPMPHDFLSPGDATRAVGRRVARRQRFFHWELEFPDVFHSQGSGFDAVVGNPPWEIRKPSSKEFFSNIDPLYRGYGKQEALNVQQTLFTAHPRIEQDWLAYLAEFKDRGNFVRSAGRPFCAGERVDGKWKGTFLGASKSGLALREKWTRRRKRRAGFADPGHPFLHQGQADLNTYKMFVEVGHALLVDDGELGLIVPSGIYTDKGTGKLRRLLLEQSRWRWLFGFENRRKIFDIDSRFKFCVLIASKGGTTESLRAAFMRHDLADWTTAAGVLELKVSDVTTFSPYVSALIEVSGNRHLCALRTAYKGSIHLGDSEGPWGVSIKREFHMTDDSGLFIARSGAELDGFRPTVAARWHGPDSETLLPLYQGAMIHQFLPSFKGWNADERRVDAWRLCNSADPAWLPKYLLPSEAYERSVKSVRSLKAGFRDIARATDERTAIAAVLPDFPCGNKVPLLTCAVESDVLPLTAVFNSFVFDWIQRSRQNSASLNYFILEENCLPPPVHCRILTPLARRLSLAGPAMAPIAVRHSNATEHHWRAVTPHERLRFRCMLDAIVTALYGLDCSDFEWILRDSDHSIVRLRDMAFCRTLDPRGFWRVDKDKPPELRHTVLSLIAFHDLQAMIESHDGDRDAGIQALCDQNDGEGWMLPETLRLADYGLGHDDRAEEHQPVASALGPRFLDWQLAQTPEESWAECERHARALASSQPSHPPQEKPTPRRRTTKPPKAPRPGLQ